MKKTGVITRNWTHVITRNYARNYRNVTLTNNTSYNLKKFALWVYIHFYLCGELEQQLGNCHQTLRNMSWRTNLTFNTFIIVTPKVLLTFV